MHLFKASLIFEKLHLSGQPTMPWGSDVMVLLECSFSVRTVVLRSISSLFLSNFVEVFPFPEVKNLDFEYLLASHNVSRS